MLITIFSGIVAITLLFAPLSFAPQLDISLLSIALMLITGSIVLAVLPFLYCLPLASFQRLEQQVTPRLMAVFHQDWQIRLYFFLLFLFPLISYLLASAVILFKTSYPLMLFAIWIVAFGGTLDLIRETMKRLTKLLDPFFITEVFNREAIKSIRNGQDSLLWSSIDNLAEVSIRATQDNRLALATRTLSTFPPIFQQFFTSAKSISHPDQDRTIKKETGLDEASYTVVYFLQRLELINDKALEAKLESICRHIIVVLGKIIVSSAQFDLSMVSFPTHILGKFAFKAQRANWNEVAALTTSTLVEVARTIVNDIDLSYTEIQDAFFAITNNLDLIAQTTFKKDKTMNIQLLTQPIREVKALFQTEKMANHRDTPAIMQNIDAILSQFEALEQVMNTIPPIPSDLKP